MLYPGACGVDQVSEGLKSAKVPQPSLEAKWKWTWIWVRWPVQHGDLIRSPASPDGDPLLGGSTFHLAPWPSQCTKRHTPSLQVVFVALQNVLSNQHRTKVELGGGGFKLSIRTHPPEGHRHWSGPSSFELGLGGVQGTAETIVRVCP